MATYKKYMHVERLGTDETEGLLDNEEVVVTAKVDGTNGVVFWDDEHNCVGVGSRNRVLSAEDDNAGFYAFVHGDSDEAKGLRAFVTEYPHLIIYGEWMGADKFTGSFKRYDRKFLNTYIIFDMYDTEQERYLDISDIAFLSGDYDLEEYIVDMLAVLHHPTMKDIERVAKENHFLMPDNTLVGEGVVCRAIDWKNKYGRVTYGKLIYKEFKSQGTNKSLSSNETVEREIVKRYLTDSELDKTMAKVCVIFDAKEFDTKNYRMRGTYISLLWKDLLDECADWVKKFRSPTVSFRTLEREMRTYANDYLKSRFE